MSGKEVSHVEAGSPEQMAAYPGRGGQGTRGTELTGSDRRSEDDRRGPWCASQNFKKRAQSLTIRTEWKEFVGIGPRRVGASGEAEGRVFKRREQACEDTGRDVRGGSWFTWHFPRTLPRGGFLLPLSRGFTCQFAPSSLYPQT